MSVRIKIDPIDRDIRLIVNEELSPEARSKHIAEFARGELDRAKDINKRAFGSVPPYETFVDGRLDAPLESVNPDRGVIVFEFELLDDLFTYIDLMLVSHSPVRTGRYQKSHIFFADGVEVEPNAKNLPAATEFVFVNEVPYARKIERGLSRQSPDGVYQVVAELAKKRFSNLAKIQFSYRTIVGNRKDRATRQPAIVIRI